MDFWQKAGVNLTVGGLVFGLLGWGLAVPLLAGAGAVALVAGLTIRAQYEPHPPASHEGRGSEAGRTHRTG